MNAEREHKHLAQADRHIAELKQDIARQWQIIEEQGLPGAVAVAQAGLSWYRLLNQMAETRAHSTPKVKTMRTLVAVAILAMVIVPPALAKAKRAKSAPQQGYQSSERPGNYHGYP